MKYFTLFLFFTVFNIFAQDNFISGTITNNDDSKIVGEINYQDWKKTPSEIEFKSNNTISVLKPEDIKTFEVENDKFISKLVTIDVTEQNLNKLDKTTEVKLEDKIIFLNVLVEGNVNLYEHYDNRSHFFAENEDNFMELINRITIGDNNIDIYENKKYVGQLKVFLSECPSVKIKSTLRYKKKEISVLVDEYNTCMTNDNIGSVYIKNSKGKKSHFYVTGGLSFSSFSINSPRIALQNFEGSKSTSINLGIAYEFLFSKNREKWSLYSELFYNSFNSTENSEQRTSFRSFTPLKMDFKTIDLSALLRYKFVKDSQKITPFLSIGLGRSFIINQNNTVMENDFSDSSRNKELPFTINSGNFLFSVGSGLYYRKMGFEIRYTISGRLTNVIRESSKLSHLRLLLSYKFK